MDAAELEVDAVVKKLAELISVGNRSIRRLRQAVGMAAFKGERGAKQALTRLVYSQAERGYKRTGTLRRSVMAASPEHDHSGDEKAAHDRNLSRGSGMGAALDVTALTGEGIESTVGSWVDYAELVNDGTTYMEPRPFLDEGLEGLDADLEHYVEHALDGILKTVLA